MLELRLHHAELLVGLDLLLRRAADIFARLSARVGADVDGSPQRVRAYGRSADPFLPGLRVALRRRKRGEGFAIYRVNLASSDASDVPNVAVHLRLLAGAQEQVNLVLAPGRAAEFAVWLHGRILQLRYPEATTGFECS